MGHKHRKKIPEKIERESSSEENELEGEEGKKRVKQNKLYERS